MTAHPRSILRSVLLLTAGASILTPPALGAASGTTAVHIARQPLDQALEALGRQTGQSIVFPPELVAHLQAPAVNGTMTPGEAAHRLLSGSGMTVEPMPGGGLVVHKASASPFKRTARKVRASQAESIEQVVATGHHTRSVMSISGDQIQEMMPGQNPMQALDLLPGVTFTNVDPWGNNEQNSSIFVHGFSNTQLGYTLDGIPLGAGAYGNYNGLSPQRAAISEDIGRTSLSSGAGALGTASTSNLGGTIEFTTRDPKRKAGATIRQTFGEYSTFRTFARVDTGQFGNGNAAYFAFARQDARPWNLGPANRQGGYQVNGKFVHRDENTTVTAYFDWQNKAEPNTQGLTAPTDLYARGAFYPDLDAAMANYPSESSKAKAPGAPNNLYYFSAAQRTDYLTYVNISHKFAPNLTWDNQLYFHYDDGAGVVATSVRTNAILTILGSYLDPTGTKYIKNGQFTYTVAGIDPKVWDATGGTGYAVRTTEYDDYRGGLMSTLHYHIGHHNIEIGGWYERNNNSQGRYWYPLTTTNTLTPYETPKNPLFTQWNNVFFTNTFVTHLQDTWRVTPHLTLTAGFKSELVYTNGTLPVAALPQSLAAAVTGAKTLVDTSTHTVPGGTIPSVEPFLPAFGALWSFTPHEQLFANIQENMNSFAQTGYGSTSPWAVTTQDAFEEFKRTGKPETSWTYETGIRTSHPLRAGPLTGISGQLEYYHVDFYNRLGAIKPPNQGISGVGGTVANLGNVSTNGMDLSFTLRFGPHFSVYDTVSYISSIYGNDFMDGATLYATKGKKVPAIPVWSDKFVISYNQGGFNAQLNGSYMGVRPGTLTNSVMVPPRLLLGVSSGYTFQHIPHMDSLKLQFNISNLTNARAWSSLTPGDADTYVGYPTPPRMFFGTIGASF
ncbi:TonB-dependent receptor [Gluconacetobacter azotocaptans]|uniref:TonB-dependent receptor plug domain-containing protein n=1 Tax=Gluconacetobacter azotocaptans TaxID=142834 RepID=UPI00195D841B|nr:TonB-dependent receptor plug domain-containing protein [Gluconacetobacter azotocaptans]MBM9402100.1 TonB-dependent receptor [Gluconacetobacter azotocaptans]